MSNNKIETRDSLGFLHADNGPAVINIDNNIIEFYWHGLLLKSIGKSTFDIKDLKDGFNEHLGTLYYIKNGKLTSYTNGRCAFTADGGCYTIDRAGDLESVYFNKQWLTWIGNKPGRVASEVDNHITNYNKQIYDLHLCSLDKTSVKTYGDQNYKYFDQFGRLHNRSGPAVIYSDNSREWWEHGLWMKTQGSDGKMCFSNYKNLKPGTWLKQAKDSSKRLYDMNGNLVDSDTEPVVKFENGNEQYYKAGKLVKEKIAGKMYLVSDGVHTETNTINEQCLVNLSIFQKEFGINWSQQDLDNKVRWFLRTQMPGKEKLQSIVDKFMQEDELKVWREVHEDLLYILENNPEFIGEFVQKLGFRKVYTFIQYWFKVEQSNLSEKVRCRVPELYARIYNKLSKQFVESEIGLDRFQTLLPGADLHQLLERMVMKTDDWKLIMHVCRVAGNINFAYLADAFEKRCNKCHSRKFVFNYILGEFYGDIAGQQQIRYLLQDMMLMD